MDEALAAEQVMQALAYMHACGVTPTAADQADHPSRTSSQTTSSARRTDASSSWTSALPKSIPTPRPVSARLTPGYAPIEQYHGGTDERSDVYVLAVTLYALLTGKAPPSATSLATGLPLPLPRTFNPDIPLRCVKVLEKAMQLKPEHRYQSIGDFYRELFDRTLPMTGSRAPTAQSTPHRVTTLRGPRFQRSPLIAGMLLAGALLSIIGIGFVFLNAPEIPSVVTTTPVAVVMQATPKKTIDYSGGGPTFTPLPALPATPTASPTLSHRRADANLHDDARRSATAAVEVTALPASNRVGRAGGVRAAACRRCDLDRAGANRDTDAAYTPCCVLPIRLHEFPSWRRRIRLIQLTHLTPPTRPIRRTHRCRHLPIRHSRRTPRCLSMRRRPRDRLDSSLAVRYPRERTRSSWVSNPYANEGDRFINDLTARLGQFQLPSLGVTQATVTGVLQRPGAEDRVNALVGRAGRLDEQ